MYNLNNNDFNLFGNMGNIPKVSELWEKEKKEYRIWIIAWIAILFIFLALIFSSSIVFWINKEEYCQFLVETGKISTTEAKQIIQANWIYNLITTIIITTIIGYYYYSIFNSYKNKNFAFLKNNLIIFLLFLCIFHLSSAIFSSVKRTQSSVSDIISISSSAYLVIASLLSFSKINKINKIFRQSLNKEYLEKQIEELKKMNIFQDGKFDPFNNAFFNPNNNDNNVGEQSAEPKEKTNAEDILEIEKINKLKELKIEQLHKMAQTLEISGFENMTKEELAKIIAKLTK